MTTTSFKSCQAGSFESFQGHRNVDLLSSVNDEGVSKDAVATTLLNVYAADTLRMKALAGQRKFQAPVADDFTRGMLAPEHAAKRDTQISSHATCTWAALLDGLASRWRGQRPG